MCHIFIAISGISRSTKMLKDYLKQTNRSIYSLSRDTGISYSTLNDFVNGKVSVDQCRTGMIKKLADAFGITMDALYDLANEEQPTVMTDYGISCSVHIAHKEYHVCFNYDGKPLDLEICKVTNDTKYYIKELAKWHVESYIRKEHMRKFGEGGYDGLFSDEKR